MGLSRQKIFKNFVFAGNKPCSSALNLTQTLKRVITRSSDELVR